MILLGIVSSGLASIVIGKGRLVIESVKEPAPGAPPGHGILMGEDEVVVIKGKEWDVNAITKGRFVFETDFEQDYKKGDIPKHHAIGVCSLLLLVQLLLQLLLIPQGSLFGQLMFLASLGVSWVYNSYLCSLEKEKLQAGILFETLGNPEMLRFRTSSRTSMAVFVCLLLFHGVRRSFSEEDWLHRLEILRTCIPNDTAAWRRWREKVVEQMLNIDDRSETLAYLAENKEDQVLPDLDKALLTVLLDDARTVFREYLHFRAKLPADSSYQR
ncbi:hypothetical protein JVT61DRAFT_4981 [Boletus reticuloceps]|uniref:Uncharacterized protein n=1 Tax=Boletus reticuloceps TaxID=495285 RepID=A0A8I3AFM1_9AGAM|nr:hypothetical protein JVT61DRAFT_4981 [Boletus reticuloceps]